MEGEWRMRAATFGVIVGALIATVARPGAVQAVCTGDCGRDCAVAINELVLTVGIILETHELLDCPSIDSDLDGVASIDEALIAVDNDLNGCTCRTGPADELLFAPQDNQLNVYALGSDDADLRIPASRGTVNGQVCALPGGSGNFVLGDDTGQPAVRPGWGIYSPDGTFLHKLTVPQRDGEERVPDPLGCGFDAAGRLFTSAIVSAPGADGQLSVFFPPTYEESCILDTTILVPGTITLDDDGRVYVPQLGGVVRYAPPFPSSPAECETVKGTKETFINDARLIAPLGIVQASNGHWYISNVFGEPTVREFDAAGSYLRDLIEPGTAGTPAGLALDAQGSLYYADLAISGGDDPGPVRDHGTVRKITFDLQGNPAVPEIVARGLTFPDAVAILPARRESRTYGGSLRRTFYYSQEQRITRQTVGRLIPRWRYTTGAVVTASPAVAEIDLPDEGPTRLVYVSSWDGNLYALRAENGRRVWSFTMKPHPGASYPNASSPTVAWRDGHPFVYVGGGMTMYCLDAVTGEEVWEFDAGTGCTDCRFDPNDRDRRERNEILSSPAVYGDRVYFGMDVDDGRGKGGLYALRADDGRLDWFFDLASGSTCRPNLDDDVRHFDGYHSAAALDLDEDFFATRAGCDFARTANTCGNVWSSVAIDARRGVLFIASSNCCTDDDPETPAGPPPMPPYDEAVFSLTLDGEPVWRWRPREIDNADLAFGATSNLFEVEIDERVREVIGIGNKDGTYYLLDRDGTNEITSTIEPYWQRTVLCGDRPCAGPAGGIIGSAAVGEERIFFSTAIGFSVSNPQLPGTHALAAGDGTLLWENADQRPSFAPTVAVPGVAFMGELSGGVHAYHSAKGTELALLDARALPGGVATAATIVAGELYVGGGTGTRGGGGPDQGTFAAGVDTPVSAFCVEGTPGCVAQPPCDDGDPCTYDYREGETCLSEVAPDTLSCMSFTGRCLDGTCVALPPCDDGNPCTNDFRDDITCVHIPEPNMTACTVDEQPGQCDAGTCVVSGSARG